MTREQDDDRDQERLLRRYTDEPRFHLAVRQYEVAAAAGGSLKVLDALRMAEQILPLGSRIVEPDEVRLIIDGLGAIASGDVGSWTEEDRIRAAAITARLLRGQS